MIQSIILGYSEPNIKNNLMSDNNIQLIVELMKQVKLQNQNISILAAQLVQLKKQSRKGQNQYKQKNVTELSTPYEPNNSQTSSSLEKHKHNFVVKKTQGNKFTYQNSMKCSNCNGRYYSIKQCNGCYVNLCSICSPIYHSTFKCSNKTNYIKQPVNPYATKDMQYQCMGCHHKWFGMECPKCNVFFCEDCIQRLNQ